ncbi:PREDICTED: apolipoprotein B-100-like [Thamnophis sirtalis]|uniref:Apolipoprotein B-100-like n=1 Tax=Thamnophis sirtalis TaxID=35019 RepID=A0A6I9YKN8_9SAUR|nr:PREDICTED: apolipoprotein B-100-like [Thamnophis sirtalis]
MMYGAREIIQGVQRNVKLCFSFSKYVIFFCLDRYELKVKIQDERNVELYPVDNEATHILNIKRGIVSALLVPTEAEDNIQTLPMDTVYGECDSNIEVKNRKSNAPNLVDIEITRNLKSCENFNPIRGYVSPIAFIKGLVSTRSMRENMHYLCYMTGIYHIFHNHYHYEIKLSFLSM